MCIRIDARELDWGISYADTRPQTTVNSPQHIQLELNPAIIWVRAANRTHIFTN
jgi:hypothetical protein